MKVLPRADSCRAGLGQVASCREADGSARVTTEATGLLRVLLAGAPSGAVFGRPAAGTLADGSDARVLLASLAVEVKRVWHFDVARASVLLSAAQNETSVLMWAAIYGRDEVARMLLDRGADLMARDKVRAAATTGQVSTAEAGRAVAWTMREVARDTVFEAQPPRAAAAAAGGSRPVAVRTREGACQGWCLATSLRTSLRT